MRLGLIFIALCMAVIAASAGATVYLGFGFSGAEAIIVGLSVLTALGLYNALSTRPATRHAPGALSPATADFANQMAEFGRRLTVVEGNVAAVQYRARAAIDPLAVEIGELGTLVRQLAETVATYESRINAIAAAVSAAPVVSVEAPLTLAPVASPTPASTAPIEPPAPMLAPMPATSNEAFAAPAPVVTAAMPSPRPTPPPAASRPPASSSAAPLTVTADEPPSLMAAAVAAAAVAAGAHVDEERLALVREALEANRIDLYLQPIVSLPQRKVRYYEALSRLRSETGEVLNAADFVPLAQRAGLMARIDNLVIFRCVQVVRRLLLKNREVGLFCNLSGSALTDATGFQELLEFLDANQAIASSIVLEFTQDALRTAGPIEHESLSALADRGFRFSLDNLDDLRIEPRELAARGFRYVKIPGRFLIDPKDMPADIHPADLSDLLGRFGIELVAEKIETEAVVVDLLDCDVRFGQGNLFSPPRPVRAEALQGIAERSDATMRNPDGRPPHLASNGLRTGLAQLARGTVTRN